MKSIILSLLFTICVLPVFSQVAVGVIGGYSHSNMLISNRHILSDQIWIGPGPMPLIPVSSDNSKYVPKWHAGLIVDIHLVKGLYIQPQLLVSTKGGDIINVTHQTSVDKSEVYKTSLVYLEMPVNLLYKFPLGKGKLAVGAGVYCARALSGTYDDRFIRRDATGTVVSDSRYTGKIAFENKESGSPKSMYTYKKHDTGLNFITGYEFKNGLLFNVNYSLGLTDTYLYSPEVRKNAYFGISAGYLFKLKRSRK